MVAKNLISRPGLLVNMIHDDGLFLLLLDFGCYPLVMCRIVYGEYLLSRRLYGL
jgi:hypothetical protein